MARPIVPADRCEQSTCDFYAELPRQVRLLGYAETVGRRNLAAMLRSRALLGKGATLLSLGRDDVLICALTEQNARNGSVCPAEIKILQKRGVRVYLRDDLHAKFSCWAENRSSVRPTCRATRKRILMRLL